MVPPTPTENTSSFDQLVDQAARHAHAQDAAYATPQEARRRRTAQIALVGALPVLALVVAWNVSLAARVILPPPEVEAVDIARTMLVTVAEVEAFMDRTGRLPVGAELSPILPPGGRLNATASGWELSAAAPLVGTLRFTDADEPDRWLEAVRSAVQPREGS
jgi:hypothetical protein